jgi:serine/threonine protein kinase
VTDVTASAFADALRDRYTIEREIGHGGMATVYLAHDLKHDRDVALKVLRPELATALGPERFLREIRLTARLSHPNILVVFDSGEAAGRLWYTVPYVAGGSLRQRLGQEAQLGIPETLRIAGQVAAALAHAHGQGIVHRDIKPENILLAGEQALVADFGLAKALDVSSAEKLTETGLSLGTPAYMSPEQAAGGAVDARSDLYALGCVVYEMLAGVPPFTGPTAQAILARHAVDSVPPLRTVRRTIPEHVAVAVEQALAKVPADRFATACEFTQALESGSTARMPLRRASFRSNRRIAAASVIGAAAIGLGVWSFSNSAKATVLPSASRMAVLPLLSLGSDTALARLGKDLANTISVSLDGVGGIEMADRLTLATSTAGREGLSPSEGAALARRLGATSFVQGTLVSAGDRVRLDLGLYGTERLEPLASGITVTAHRDSIGTLTDSASLGLLRQIWQRGQPPSPSLDAVATKSFPALRAFLEGERAIGIDRWNEAQLAFHSAIAADSGFWMAHFRYALTKWWNREPVDRQVLDVLRLHRDRFPEREQLLLDAFLTIERTPRLRIERFAIVTRRFPDYWPGWWLYADALHHNGPLSGYDWSEALEAFHRVVALNPGLVDAWTHIFDLTTGKNRAENANAFAKLTELGWVDSLPPAARFGARLQFALDGSGGLLTPEVGELIDSFAEFMPTFPRPAITLEQQLAYEPVFLVDAGFPSAQLELNRRAVATGRLMPEVAQALRMGDAWAWATRGRWDSALTIVSAPEAQGEAYRLAVLGAWLGATPPALADQRRSAALARIERMEPGRPKQQQRARMAWFDGLLGLARGDRSAIRRARQDAAASGWDQADLVGRSLEAFDTALGGDRKAAGRKLAELEEDCLDNENCNSWVPPWWIQRLLAGQWLQEAGAQDEAGRLLRWQDAPRGADVCYGCAVLDGPTFLARARIEVARGDSTRAREYYRQFLQRYDQPMASQVHLVREAEAALIGEPHD